ncbi:LuxR C-terminal-related transcriptional regulator [Bacillus horti]|uniref:LuxR family maltose regulon positive regulatory protein n=1 Tax=Caldalkalibacillus horti TaxID=77523 RepID=A0ABT9W096_9BACI|nr:LuxR C-terminal-related transcriptional regulator [Bacillus horti]MDQ0166290.1 LuxR family maltose regulon positive regulatory protein [Bacillus horti]
MEKKDLFSSRILKTKLHIPGSRSKMIPRPFLYEKLQAAAKEKLTVVLAPAGFGKSTLLSQWIRESNTPSGWVSLDKNDNDPVRFWEYFISALNVYQAGFGQNTLLVLRSAGHSDPELYMYTLLEELEQIKEPMVIVLDDFHEITSSAVHQGMSILLQHLPQQLHIMLSTRQEPIFPRHKLRVRNELTEIGMTDLRFTAKELQHFFNDVLEFNLSLENVLLLQKSTEGWAAGAQLAALSMNGDYQPANSLISTLSGNMGYISEYLEAEVLEQHPHEVQLFLVKTSLLKRMNGFLCDALTGQGNGHVMLQHLEKNNAFIIPLDHEQTWYRYHHLFADLLQSKLYKIFPKEVQELHRQASQWYAQNGFSIEAIEHAFEAQDYELAATFIDQEAPYLLKKAEMDTLLRWLERFPPGWVNQRSMLSLIKACCLAVSGQLDKAGALLQLQQEKISSEASLSIQSKNELLAEVDAISGYISLVKGEHQTVIELFSSSGQKQDKVSRFFEVGLELNTYEATPIRGVLGFKGALTKVKEVYPELRKLFWNRGLAITGYGSVIMSELLYEFNDMEQTEYFVLRGIELGKKYQNIGILVPTYITYVRYQIAQGHINKAFKIVGELEHHITSEFTESSHLSHWITVLKALQALIWIREGNRKEVYRWLKKSPMSIHDVHTSHKEFEQFIRVRAYLRVGETKEAFKLLERLKEMTESEERLGSQIETFLLLGIGYHLEMDEIQAQYHIEQALRLAEPEGYVRLFLDEEKELAPLLTKVVRKKEKDVSPEENKSLNYARFLLEHMMVETDSRISNKLNVIEPLTAREEEVLSLIDKGFTNKEIAYSLDLSEGTVKGYCHKIFAKLQVTNRTQAMAKLREMRAP